MKFHMHFLLIVHLDDARHDYSIIPPSPPRPPVLQFLVDTGGLNAYPHTYLMLSGKMLLQANVSTSQS